MTELVLRTRYGTYTISICEDDLDMGNLMDKLVVPMLFAAGYSEHTIKQYVDTELHPMEEEQHGGSNTEHEPGVRDWEAVLRTEDQS